MAENLGFGLGTYWGDIRVMRGWWKMQRNLVFRLQDLGFRASGFRVLC